MHHNIFLVKTLTGENYTVNIYSVDENLNIDNFISSNANFLENKSPRDIGDALLVIENVNMIKVFDSNDKVIFTTSNILPEEIDVHE